ncbi:MAG: hypothetical protein AAGJ31_08735 [Verrucomicrobiota bacterium]
MFRKSFFAMSMLGEPVVAYERYRRGELFLQFAICAVLAALGWWGARLLEGQLLMILLALPAVGLSLVAFQLFLRILDPGKRVAVYELGLAFGKRELLWEEVEKVSHELLDVTQNGATHQELRITVFPRERGEESMVMTNETLPFHVDREAFVHALEQRGVLVEDELAPKEHRVGGGSTLVVRQPDLEIQLHEEFQEVFENSGAANRMTEVLGALENGNRERRRRRRTLVLRYLCEKALHVVGTVAGAACILALVPLAAMLLNAVVQLFRGTFRLEGPGLFFAAVGLVVLGWAGTRCWKPLEKLGERVRRLWSRVEAIREPAVVTEAQLSQPHLLFLRSFQGEYFRYLESSVDRGSMGMATKYETLERELDQLLVETVEGRVPLFALANAQDASASRDLRVLYVPTPDWVKVAGLLMIKSSAIILHLSALTESVMAELWALDRLDAQDRTFVILGSEFPYDQLTVEESARLEGFAHRENESAAGLSQSLTHFLAQH